MKKIALYVATLFVTQLLADLVGANRTWSVAMGWIACALWFHFEKSVSQRSPEPP